MQKLCTLSMTFASYLNHLEYFCIIIPLWILFQFSGFNLPLKCPPDHLLCLFYTITETLLPA